MGKIGIKARSSTELPVVRWLTIAVRASDVVSRQALLRQRDHIGWRAFGVTRHEVFGRLFRHPGIDKKLEAFRLG
jgi:hypothetical protein